MFTGNGSAQCSCTKINYSRFALADVKDLKTLNTERRTNPLHEVTSWYTARNRNLEAKSTLRSVLFGTRLKDGSVEACVHAC